MNRVAQYVHVATPKRSTFTGGAPQFGQLSAIGPCVPAGTIGCWIGGGGGRFERWSTPVAASTPKTMRMRTTKHSGARNAIPNDPPPTPSMVNIRTPIRRKTTATTATITIATWFPGDRRGGAQYGWGPYVGGPDGGAVGCTVAGWRVRMMKAMAECPRNSMCPGRSPDEVPRLAVRAGRDAEPVDPLRGGAAVRARDLDRSPGRWRRARRGLDRRGRRGDAGLRAGIRHREHGPAPEHQAEPEDRHQDRVDNLRHRGDEGAEHEDEEPQENQRHPDHVRGVVLAPHGLDERDRGRLIRLGHGGTRRLRDR